VIHCITLPKRVLSPVPSFTSEPTPNQLRNLRYSLSLICSHSDSYLLIFLVPILFTPASFSVRPFPIIMWLLTMWFLISHAPVSCVDSTSCPYDRSSPRTLYPLLPPNSDTRSRSTPWLRTPPVFKPAVSLDTNQSDYCISPSLLCLFAFLSLPHCFLSSFCNPPPTNSLSPDFCPTPVSDLPEIIGHTADRTSGRNT